MINPSIISAVKFIDIDDEPEFVIAQIDQCLTRFGDFCVYGDLSDGIEELI